MYNGKNGPIFKGTHLFFLIFGLKNSTCNFDNRFFIQNFKQFLTLKLI